MGTQAHTCHNCQFAPLPADAETCPQCGQQLADAGGKLLPANQKHISDQTPQPATQIKVIQQVGNQDGGNAIGAQFGQIQGDVWIGWRAEEVKGLLERIQADFQPRPYSGLSPYLGLNYFNEQDAQRFFGRESLVKELIQRIASGRFICVAGPSGSGKSSLARAGLLHNLRSGALPGSENWLYGICHPGREPLKALGKAAAAMTGTLSAEDEVIERGLTEPDMLTRWLEVGLGDQDTRRAVLVVDQFEEIFTQVSQKQEALRTAFIRLLTEVVGHPKGRATVVLVMRSDFITNCASYPELNALINQSFLQVGPLSPDEMVSAIARPALQEGLRVEPDLITQIVEDMAVEPGALPLMQFALQDLFEYEKEQNGGGVPALTLDGYLQRGGLHKALERHADQAFSQLEPEEKKLARIVFSGLVQPGHGAQDTRRTARFSEIAPADVDPESVARLIRKLADERLITTEDEDSEGPKEPTATIAHERLLQAWPWLRKLVDENRDLIVMQNQIAEDAKLWDTHGRDASYLYQRARLATAVEQHQAKKLVLSEIANDFIHESYQRQQRDRRVRILSIADMIGLFIAGIILFSTNSVGYSKKLAEQSDNFASTQIALKITSDANAQEAQNQAQRARAGELTAQSYKMLNKKFQVSMLLAVEAFQSYSTTVRSRGALLDVTTANPQLIQFLSGYGGLTYGVAFSPDGKTIALGNNDGTILLWDLDTRQPIEPSLSRHKYAVWSLAFSPDGKTLASGSSNGTIMLWDVVARRAIGEPLLGHTGSIRSLAFSTDGKTLASGSRDGTIILWDVSTGQVIRGPLSGHKGGVESVAFRPDGNTLASGSQDGTIILWDIGTGQPLVEPLSGHDGAVWSVTFSPDGEMLASGGEDGTIILWDVVTRQPKGGPLSGREGSIWSLAFSPDGKTLASGSFNNMISLWDVGTRQPIGGTLVGHPDFVRTVAFSPDGLTLISGSRDGTVVLWDVGPPQTFGALLREQENSVTNVTFSPNGETLAAGGDNGTIILWDLITHQSLGKPLSVHTDTIKSISFSPYGETLASGGEDGTIILWDVSTHQAIGEPLSGHTDTVTSISFSPDGETLASGSRDGTIILWDVSIHQAIGEPLSGHMDWVNSVTFSPNGETLASGSRDGTIILWDVDTRQAIGEPLSGHSKGVNSVAFSPDGKTLASGGNDGPVILLDVDTSLWIEKTCQRVGRNLSLAEWSSYFYDEEYRQICSQYPKASDYYRQIAEEILSNVDDPQRIQKALNQVRDEMEMDSAIENKLFESAYIITDLVVREISSEMDLDNWSSALDLLSQFKELSFLLPDGADFFNSVCRQGSLQGYAAQVLEYCELAVELAPDKAYIRDSRGLTLALNGKLEEASDDFQYYVDSSKDGKRVGQRKGWIRDLQAGVNPFTPEVLEALKDQ